MAKRDKGRGRSAPQLPPVKATIAERDWLRGEVARLIALGHRTNVTDYMRDRVFKDMPGYGTVARTAPEQSLDVECPRCGAKVGERCHLVFSSASNGRGAPRLPHMQRFDALLKARQLDVNP